LHLNQYLEARYRLGLASCKQQGVAFLAQAGL
jgi:hypothetical protein